MTVEEIYICYMPDLFRYLHSLTGRKTAAEDLVHDTFCRVLIHLDSYKGEEIRPWLFKIAYHAFIDWQRKERRLADEEIQLHQLPSQKSAEEEAMLRHELEEWQCWLSRLTALRRNVVVLRDYYGFSYQEITELTGLTLTKVKMELYRGRQEWKRVREEEE